jgi:hypothetical protein
MEEQEAYFSQTTLMRVRKLFVHGCADFCTKWISRSFKRQQISLCALVVWVHSVEGKIDHKVCFARRFYSPMTIFRVHSAFNIQDAETVHLASRVPAVVFELIEIIYTLLAANGEHLLRQLTAESAAKVQSYTALVNHAHIHLQ